MTYQIYLEICKKKLLVTIEADSAPLAVKQIKDSIYFYKIVKVEEPEDEIKRAWEDTKEEMNSLFKDLFGGFKK